MAKALRNLRTAAALVRQVRNWREVCLCWLRNDTGPPLVFRRGLVIQGGLKEHPLQGFDSVFRDHDYRQHLKEPDAGELVDIGANIGALSLDWLSRNPGVKVHAYEPSPGAFEVLRVNLMTNCFYDRARIYNEGVWRSPGTLEMVRVSSVATTAFAGSGSGGQRFSTKTVGLDEVVGRCEQTEPLALVKIDTEGAEAEILEGASEATLARIKQFVIEYHDFLVPGSLARCQRVLATNDFRFIVRPTGGAVGLLYAARCTV